VAGSHAPFVLVNRAVNPLVRGVLRSPAHGLLSGRLALLTVTGRRSRRPFTFPVGYRREEGDRVTIKVGWPERKRWWRNLLGAAQVEIRLAGVRRTGTGRAHGDERSGVTVEIELDGAAGGATVT
jgi:deazaflavin-dependent oxidoreductase (nitroreductase family)